MVSKLQYKSYSSIDHIKLALNNLNWLIAQKDTVNIDVQTIAASHKTCASFDDKLNEQRLRPQLEEILQNSNSHFLGPHVESLWQCYLEYSERYELLAKNLQINVDGVTLGEFDFLVHDKHTEQIIHQELAIKFYLGVPYSSGSSTQTYWVGPNQIDRLDIKLRHLNEHQLRLSEHKETFSSLEHFGAPPFCTECIIRGRLFLPFNSVLRDQMSLEDVNEDAYQHSVWVHVSEFQDWYALHPWADTFFVLKKKQWLDIQVEQNDALNLSELQESIEQDVENEGRAILVLATDKKSKQAKLLFVVHDTWLNKGYEQIQEDRNPLQP
ncbi:hypothetical protein A3762_15190 [Oleiphilus sp. HI0125]|uniref:DUF1853 family protein n=1 Tax=Oleiphilus sp. HI0125 TaxID=1822266 RepID=UPI0007C4051B|nr:DUF1853 family protein [Oleiphilus sp. HI0125]KZZ60742.1 hypothetical protein A3762_15190 [Oleiphilus sp. HI0125]